MNILGVGSDIVSLKRVRAISFFNRVAQYVFLEDELLELADSPDPHRHLASRFAAKEAIIKAFPDTLSYQDFSIVKKGKKPTVRFRDVEKNTHDVFLSISHEFDYVVAFAVIC